MPGEAGSAARWPQVARRFRRLFLVEAGARLEPGVQQLALELANELRRAPLHLLVLDHAPQIAARAPQPHAAAINDRSRLNADTRDRPVHHRSPDLRDSDDAALDQPAGMIARELRDELVGLGEHHAAEVSGPAFNSSRSICSRWRVWRRLRSGRDRGRLAYLTGVYDRLRLTQKGVHCVIDRLREQIHQISEELAGEAEPRRMLAALDPRSEPAPASE